MQGKKFNKSTRKGIREKTLYLRREERNTERCRKRIIIPRVLELFNNCLIHRDTRQTFRERKSKCFETSSHVGLVPLPHRVQFQCFWTGNVCTLCLVFLPFTGTQAIVILITSRSNVQFWRWLNSFSPVSSKQRVNLDNSEYRFHFFDYINKNSLFLCLLITNRNNGMRY